MCMEEVLNAKWDIHPYAQGSGITGEEGKKGCKNHRWGMSARKQCLLGMTGLCTRELTVPVTASTNPTQDQASPNPSLAERCSREVWP